MAELIEDQSCYHTDYHGHTTTREVVIGWRRGSREDFRQLRAVAATFEPTKHLGPDATGDIEHRENYSMGGGNYVKDGSRHASGWKVSSCPINSEGRLSVFTCVEDGLPEDVAPEAKEDSGTTEGEGWQIVQQYHKKRQIDIWTVVLSDRTERETFIENRTEAKRQGGWWYRAFAGNLGGFHFDNEETAKDFAENSLKLD